MFANARNLLELTWVKVVPGSPIENRTIGELAIRKQTGASVVSVIRLREVNKIRPKGGQRDAEAANCPVFEKLKRNFYNLKFSKPKIFWACQYP